MTWDSGFMERSPILAPLAHGAASLRACVEWPRRDALQSMLTAAGAANAQGVALTLVAPAAEVSLAYERDIYERGELQVREEQWHDLFNVLAWLAYPRTKAALNASHVGAMGKRGRAEPSTGARGRVRDALTIFDESGAIFASRDESLLEDLRAFRWKDLFWTKRRSVIQNVRVFVFGHALFEKALNAYVGMTAHALPLRVDDDFTAESTKRQLQIVDERAAEALTNLASPQDLSPLPLLGVPGWWRDNERESFYDNTAYFRAGRRG